MGRRERIASGIAGRERRRIRGRERRDFCVPDSEDQFFFQLRSPRLCAPSRDPPCEACPRRSGERSLWMISPMPSWTSQSAMAKWGIEWYVHVHKHESMALGGTLTCIEKFPLSLQLAKEHPVIVHQKEDLGELESDPEHFHQLVNYVTQNFSRKLVKVK